MSAAIDPVLTSPSVPAAAAPTVRAVADFWFDPTCPWVWVTSRWLLEVQQFRDIEVRWHLLSISHLNVGKEIPERFRAAVEHGWGALRVLAAAADARGEQVLLPLYTAMGTRLHVDRVPNDRAMHEAALREAGLPVALADAAQDTSWDAVIIASHERGMSLVGDAVGPPVIRIDGQAVSGPLLASIPRSQDAIRLWDGLTAVLSVDGFFEIKRTRDRGPVTA